VESPSSEIGLDDRFNRMVELLLDPRDAVFRVEDFLLPAAEIDTPLVGGERVFQIAGVVQALRVIKRVAGVPGSSANAVRSRAASLRYFSRSPARLRAPPPIRRMRAPPRRGTSSMREQVGYSCTTPCHVQSTSSLSTASRQ
jgi:hypothetical protein